MWHSRPRLWTLHSTQATAPVPHTIFRWSGY